MKVRYTGNRFDGYVVCPFKRDKIYDVISIERGFYRIQGELEEDYLFPSSEFETVDDTGSATICDNKSVLDDKIFDLIIEEIKKL